MRIIIWTLIAAIVTYVSNFLYKNYKDKKESKDKPIDITYDPLAELSKKSEKTLLQETQETEKAILAKKEELLLKAKLKKQKEELERLENLSKAIDSASTSGEPIKELEKLSGENKSNNMFKAMMKQNLDFKGIDDKIEVQESYDRDIQSNFR